MKYITLWKDRRSSPSKVKYESYLAVILQIGFIDMVFTFASVLTAIGLFDIIGVMVTAIVIAILVIMLAAGPITRSRKKHPWVGCLAKTLNNLSSIDLARSSTRRH
ncbi:MAG: hypothetical protein F4039_09340 [Gammaproteobacteria bacterium]|nr:hypothetical protein [Gammaproteobacteria bacterium]MYF53809.1 hypothetical protein [Gammaproteobacteria bacterium]MYK44274.1 hypothetical protein [Gammaproteobacteria bacterium]